MSRNSSIVRPGLRLGVLGNSKNVSSAARKMASATYTLVERCEGRLSTGPFGNQSRGSHTSDDYVELIEPLLANNPELVLIGDETNGVHGVPLRRIKANYDEIIARCLAHPSVAKIVIELTPKALRLLDKHDRRRVDLNGYIADKANERIIVVNTEAAGYVCTDPEVCRDGTHPTAFGAMKILGPAEADAFRPLLPKAAIFPPAGEMSGNLNRAWAMAGTGGQLDAACSGVVADGWTLANTAGVRAAASKGALAKGAEAQVLTISGECSDEQGQILLRHIAPVPVMPGQFFEGWAEYEISDSRGGKPKGLVEYAFRDFGSMGYFRRGKAANFGGDVPRHRGILRMTPTPVTRASESGSLNLMLGFRKAVAVDCVVKVGRRFLVEAETAAYAPPYDQSRSRIGYDAPALTGNLAVGARLTAQVGSFSGGGLAYRCQWLRNGVQIEGAVGPSYQVGNEDRSCVLNVAVTASNALGSATARSANTEPVA